MTIKLQLFGRISYLTNSHPKLTVLLEIIAIYYYKIGSKNNVFEKRKKFMILLETMNISAKSVRLLLYTSWTTRSLNGSSLD